MTGVLPVSHLMEIGCTPRVTIPPFESGKRIHVSRSSRKPESVSDAIPTVLKIQTNSLAVWDLVSQFTHDGHLRPRGFRPALAIGFEFQ